MAKFDPRKLLLLRQIWKLNLGFPDSPGADSLGTKPTSRVDKSGFQPGLDCGIKDRGATGR